MNEYLFEQINVGDCESFSVRVTEEMENSFRDFTGDLNPLHRDDDFAMEVGNGKFSRHIIFGMLTASFYSTLAGVYMPGKYSLIHSFENISFKNPVYAGDMLTVSGTVQEKHEGINLIVVKAIITNQEKRTVSSALIKIFVMK